MAKKTKKYRHAKEIYQELERLKQSKKKDLPKAFNQLMQLAVRLVEERSGLEYGLASAMDSLDEIEAAAVKETVREDIIRRDFGIGEDEELPYWKRIFLEMFPLLGGGSVQTAGKSPEEMQNLLVGHVRLLVAQFRLNAAKNAIRAVEGFFAAEKRRRGSWRTRAYNSPERQLMELLYREKSVAETELETYVSKQRINL